MAEVKNADEKGTLRLHKLKVNHNEIGTKNV